MKPFRTVYHVQQHRRGQESLWWEVDGEDLLGRRPSCAAEYIWSLLRWWCRAVYNSISYINASVQRPVLVL